MLSYWQGDKWENAVRTEKGNTRRRALKPFWSRKDRKLFRLNLAIYQEQQGKPAKRLQQRKTS